MLRAEVFKIILCKADNLEKTVKEFPKELALLIKHFSPKFRSMIEARSTNFIGSKVAAQFFPNRYDRGDKMEKSVKF